MRSLDCSTAAAMTDAALSTLASMSPREQSAWARLIRIASRSPDEAVLLEPLLGHLFGQQTVDVDLGVERLQGLGVELLGDRAEDLVQLVPVLVVHSPVHGQREVVDREERLVVLEDHHL